MFKKDYIVGLDIGSSSLKLVEFMKKEDGLHLVKACLEEIVPAKDESFRRKEILPALKKILREVDTKKSKFIININCPETAVRTITVPRMPKGELRDCIKLEAKNYFPFPIDEALLDYEISGDIVENGVKKYQVVVATTPGKTVDEYLSLLKKAGIKPGAFVPIPYTLQKSAQALYSKGDKIVPVKHPLSNGVNCFVELGYYHTELVILKGRDLLLSRKIPVAGSDLTKAMTAVLVSDRGRTELTLEEAEKIKREVGIPGGDECKVIDDKISTTQILPMVRAPLEQLVSEIDRCFDYYREETGDRRIDSLMLLGGGAALRGISKFLSEGLGIEVTIGDPLAGLKTDTAAIGDPFTYETVAYRLGPAIGAALSRGKGINLLPSEIKDVKKRIFIRTTVEIVVVAVILILEFVYIGMRTQLSNYQKKIDVARHELSNLQPPLERIATQNSANNILAEEPYWEDIFKELSNITPGDVYITELDMENKSIKVKGVIFSEEREEALSGFIFALEKGIFKNVKLVTTKEVEGKKANEYELRCWVD